MDTLGDVVKHAFNSVNSKAQNEQAEEIVYFNWRQWDIGSKRTAEATTFAKWKHR